MLIRYLLSAITLSTFCLARPVNVVLSTGEADPWLSVELSNAALLFRSSGASIQFSLKKWVFPGRQAGDCYGDRYFAGSPPPRRDTVYVYRGTVSENCTEPRNIIYLEPRGPLDALAHELGHALGLYGSLECAHADNCADRFRPDNVMWRSNGILKNHFTAGQAACLGSAQLPLQRQLPLWTGNVAQPSAHALLQGVAAYSDRATLEAALVQRYLELERFVSRNPEFRALPPLNVFLGRYRPHYFAVAN